MKRTKKVSFPYVGANEPQEFGETQKNSKRALTFGDVLKGRFLDGRGLDQKTLAERSGVAASTLSRVFSSEQKVTEKIARKLSPVLEVSELFLMNLSDLCYLSCNADEDLPVSQSEMIKGYESLHGVPFSDPDSD